MSYYGRGDGLGLANIGYASLGQEPTQPKGLMGTLGTLNAIGSFVSGPVLVYHGYKRNRSIGWAIAWGFGSLLWPIFVPIAFAQGFAKPKVKRNPRRRTTRRPSRRRTSRRRRRTTR